MLTLYITNTQMTLLSLLKSSSREAMYSLHIPFESFNAALLAERLIHFVKEKHLTGSAVVLAISMEHLISREVVWHKKFSDWQIYQSIQMNFSQYFSGASVDEFLLDFEAIKWKDTHEGENQYLLQIYAVPKVLIGSYVAMLEYAGLKVMAVNIDRLVLKDFFCDLEKRTSFEPGRLKFGMIIEEGFVWLIERLAQGHVRLEKFVLFPSWSSSVFLDFFQSFVGEEILETPDVFFIGESQATTAMRDILNSKLGIKCCQIDPFTNMECLSGLLDSHFIASYPISLAVHCGLRGHYGN